MPTLAKQLTALAAEKAKPKASPYTLASGNGLYLVVLPGGGKQWLVRYRKPDGSRSKVIVGTFPDMTLAQAHSKAAEIHLAARTGGEIAGKRAEARAAKDNLTEAERQAKKAAEDAHKHSFNVLSEGWLAAKKPGWADESYRKAAYVVRTYLQPKVGDLDMRTMRSKDVTGLLREMSSTTPSLAKKAVEYLHGIVTYCIQEGVRDDDQVLVLSGVLPSRKGGHIPAITRQQDIGPLMKAIHAYEGVVVRNALLLAAWTTLRSGVIASARWAEIDLERGAYPEFCGRGIS